MPNRKSTRFVAASAVVLWGMASTLLDNHSRIWSQSVASPTHPPPGIAPQADVRDTVLALRGVTVIDVTDGRLLPEQVVVIVGRTIQTVGSAASVAIPNGARVVAAEGKYLIPGLWDMHLHPMGFTDVFYPLLIANGVTGIRDAGTSVPLDTLLQWRREVVAGRRVGPRHLAAGPSLNDFVRDSADSALVRRGGISMYAHQVPVSTPADARRVVDSLKRAGADFIKSYGYRDSRAVYLALAAEARRVGIPFGGHAPYGVTALEASDSGASVFDHGADIPECLGEATSVERCVPTAERLKRNGTWLELEALPLSGGPLVRRTRAPERFWPYRECIDLIRQQLRDKPQPEDRDTTRAERESWVRFYRIADESDLPIVMGTDGGVFPMLTPGFALHDGLARSVTYLERSPLKVLQAVTLNPAKLLHATDSLGTIAAGKLADLVLLDANPLANIHHTTTIRAVVANGRYFDRAALDDLLMEAERAAAAWGTYRGKHNLRACSDTT